MSTQREQYIQDLEAQKEGMKFSVEIGERLDRLLKNHDFKAVVLDLWLVKEAARYAQLSQDPGLDEPTQKDSANMAAAAGHFKRWLSVTQMQARVAAESLAATEAELDRARGNEMEFDDEETDESKEG